MTDTAIENNEFVSISTSLDTDGFDGVTAPPQISVEIVDATSKKE